MAEKKIRMATSEKPGEQGHTIVGGRPQATRSMRSDIPRALEILVKRAAIDSKFKTELLARRDKIADDLQLPLDESERAMLACIPAEHLEKMIKTTEVPPAQRSMLAKGTAAAMLALLAQLTFAPVPGRAETPPELSSKPIAAKSETEKVQPVTGIRPDLKQDDHLADRGARPDFPEPIIIDEPTYTDNDPDGTDSDEPSAPEFAKVVSMSIAGNKLSEAIKMLETNTGVVIKASGINDRLAEHLVESDVNGLPLKMAIETICAETSSETCEFEILWKNEPPSIEINFHESLQTISPAETHNDSAIIRGIRSDFPKAGPRDFVPEDNK